MRSGHCNLTHPPEIHQRCSGAYSGLACSCDCHREAPMPESRVGFHPDIPEVEYHADRTSLSVSGAKTLLKAPALFKWQQDNPVHKDVFDIGSAAHALVLGVGAEIVEVRVEVETKRGGEKRTIIADSWAFKAADEAREAARAEGKVPLLPVDYERVHNMSDALSQHTLAMQLLSEGEPEVSAYAIDPPTGILRRGRFDWLGKSVLTDYKTAASAHPDAFGRAAASFGYHMQNAWYLDLARDLGHPAQAFAFIVQMKEPPYLVTVVELDDAAVQRGRELNREALERFRDCTDAGIWPGYIRDDSFARVSLPRWAFNTNDTEEVAI